MVRRPETRPIAQLARSQMSLTDLRRSPLRCTGEAEEAKEPKRAAFRWYDAKPGPANDMEVLMIAVILVYTASCESDILNWVTSMLAVHRLGAPSGGASITRTPLI